jgi:beta-galactosidase GanA
LFAADGASDFFMRFGALPGTLEVGTGDGDPAPSLAAIKKFQPGAPVMMAEYWDGWFDHWGEQHNTRDPAQMASYVDSLLATGASVNLYMACGGTNFGFTSGANTSGTTYQPTVTSYDYDSPVGEAGDLGAKFTALRSVLTKYTGVPSSPIPGRTARLPGQTVTPSGAVSLLDSLPVLATPVRSAMSTQQKLFGWEIRPLPLEDLSRLRFTTGPVPGPAFHRATVELASPEDGFVALPGWEKGIVWLNGFNLGRYWKIGPQRTLYAPKPLWRKGVNEIVVLELHQPGATIEIRPDADLG